MLSLSSHRRRDKSGSGCCGAHGRRNRYRTGPCRRTLSADDDHNHALSAPMTRAGAASAGICAGNPGTIATGSALPSTLKAKARQADTALHVMPAPRRHAYVAGVNDVMLDIAPTAVGFLCPLTGRCLTLRRLLAPCASRDRAG